MTGDTYTLTVDGFGTTSDLIGTITTGNTTHYCTAACNHWNNWSYWYPQTVYLYQIKCPKCKTMNWLELEKVVNCTKCSASLKAVANQPDYTIPVT